MNPCLSMSIAITKLTITGRGINNCPICRFFNANQLPVIPAKSL